MFEFCTKIYKYTGTHTHTQTHLYIPFKDNQSQIYFAIACRYVQVLTIQKFSLPAQNKKKEMDLYLVKWIEMYNNKTKYDERWWALQQRVSRGKSQPTPKSVWKHCKTFIMTWFLVSLCANSENRTWILASFSRSWIVCGKGCIVTWNIPIDASICNHIQIYSSSSHIRIIIIVLIGNFIVLVVPFPSLVTLYKTCNAHKTE